MSNTNSLYNCQRSLYMRDLILSFQHITFQLNFFIYSTLPFLADLQGRHNFHYVRLSLSFRPTYKVSSSTLLRLVWKNLTYLLFRSSETLADFISWRSARLLRDEVGYSGLDRFDYPFIFSLPQFPFIFVISYEKLSHWNSNKFM